MYSDSEANLVRENASLQAKVERQAAEIERLKETLELTQGSVDYWAKTSNELRAELEQLRKAQGEPVAWYHKVNSRVFLTTCPEDVGDCEGKLLQWKPLYTHPAPEQVEQLKAEIERLKDAADLATSSSKQFEVLLHRQAKTIKSFEEQLTRQAALLKQCKVAFAEIAWSNNSEWQQQRAQGVIVVIEEYERDH